MTKKHAYITNIYFFHLQAKIVNYRPQQITSQYKDTTEYQIAPAQFFKTCQLKFTISD